MKKIKLMKTVLLLLFTVFAFSNCEEDGPIQFIVVDEFESNATVQGLQGQSTFNISQTSDVSDLLDNASTFVAAEVEKVTILINSDYSGSTIGGDFSLVIGGNTLIDNQRIDLSKITPGAEIDIPVSSRDVLSNITSGQISFTFSGVADSEVEDDDFSLNLKFKIRATVQ
jgi:hypothetical protein